MVDEDQCLTPSWTPRCAYGDPVRARDELDRLRKESTWYEDAYIYQMEVE